LTENVIYYMNRKRSIIINLLFFIFFNHPILQSQSRFDGTRIDLTQDLNLNTGQSAQLFIPGYLVPPTDGKFLLIFHLHSATWAAENMLYKSRANAVLFNIHLGPFSSWYGTKYFADSTKFKQILDDIILVINEKEIINNPEVNRLVLTSFSAGYAGVREILKVKKYYEKIDGIILADGLHCDLAESIAKDQMGNFMRFASDAAAGKKIMIVTHSSITTDGYQSTTQTSKYLIDNLGMEMKLCNLPDEIGIQYAWSRKGNFLIRSYYGETATDHLKHLHAMDKMLKFVIDIFPKYFFR